MNNTRIISVRLHSKHIKILEKVKEMFGLSRNKAVKISISNYWLKKLRERNNG